MTPAHEEARLAELHRFGILDTLPEPQFDRIVALAARYLNMPMAAVSLVDRDRQWFKARLGIIHTATSRSESICAVAIEQHHVLVIPDAQQDPRVNGMDCVKLDETVRFYAGAPLRTPDGHHLGTVCVMDAVPRTFSPEEEEILEDFAALVMNELRLHTTLQQLGDLAMIDSLTGLPNRASFYQRLALAMRRADRRPSVSRLNSSPSRADSRCSPTSPFGRVIFKLSSNFMPEPPLAGPATLGAVSRCSIGLRCTARRPRRVPAPRPRRCHRHGLPQLGGAALL